MLAAGEQARGQALLEQVIARYPELYTRGSVNYPMRIASVDALIALGRHDEAVAELERRANDGFRVMWSFYTTHSPVHDAIKDREDYQAIMQWVSEDLARQREAGAELIAEIEAQFAN